MPASCEADWLAGCLPSFIPLFIFSELFVYVLLFHTQGEESPDQGTWKKLDFIPEKYMGAVIGRNGKNLNKIEQKTGATLRVWGRKDLYIKGSPESQKRAIREIKEQVVSLAMKESVNRSGLNFATCTRGENVKSVLTERHNEWTPVLLGLNFSSRIFCNANPYRILAQTPEKN